MKKPTITPYTKDGKQYFRVDRGPGYKPRTKNFTIQEEAEEHAISIWRTRATEGRDALKLSMEQRADAVRAFGLLNGAATLTEAVQYFVSHQFTEENNPRIADAMDEYIEAKKAADRRPATIDEIKYKVGRLSDAFPGMRLREITIKDATRYLNSLPKKGRDQHKRVCGALWNWAAKPSRGYCDVNPFADVETPEKEEGYAEVHTVDEVRACLQWAADNSPKLLPYLVLGYFAGLRGNEARTVKYSDIDMLKKRVRVDPDVAKRRRQRYVDLPDCAVAWLAVAEWGEYAEQVYYSRVYMRRMRKECGGVVVKHSTLRHCYGSHRLAQTGNAAQTAAELGHDVATLYKHYRDGLITKEEADEYFSIRPRGDDGNIIVMNQATA